MIDAPRFTSILKSMNRLRLAVLVPLVALTGCMASQANFKPTGPQKQLLAEPPLPFAVSVVHWRRGQGRNAQAYHKNLTKLLRASGAFRSVTYDSLRQVPADLYVESRGDYCNTAVIPIFTLLTLGIVPTIWKETDCTGMIFRPVNATAGSDSVVVRVSHTGTAVMGWIA